MLLNLRLHCSGARRLLLSYRINRPSSLTEAKEIYWLKGPEPRSIPTTASLTDDAYASALNPRDVIIIVAVGVCIRGRGLRKLVFEWFVLS